MLVTRCSSSTIAATHAGDGRWSVGEQRRVLVLDAVARRRVCERDALRHNAPRAGRKCRLDEDTGSLGPHAVVRVEYVGIPPVDPRRQRGELVDHGVGRGVGHGCSHPVGVEHVADDRVGANRIELRGTQYRARHRRHLVSRRQQLRHERAADTPVAPAKNTRIVRLRSSWVES